MPRSQHLILTTSLIVCSLLTSCAALRSRPKLPSSPPQKALIVEAHEAGISPEINEAIFKLLSADVLTSASVVVVGPNFDDVLAFAKSNPNYDWGVELAIASDSTNGVRLKPILPVSSIPSLVDSHGFFHPLHRVSSAQMNPSEVEKELRAQIAFANQSGLHISHLTSYIGALYETPELVDVFLKLSLDLELPTPVPQLEHFRYLACYQYIRSKAPEIYPAVRAAEFPVFSNWEINYRVAPKDIESYFTAAIQALPEGLSLLSVKPAAAPQTSALTATDFAFRAESYRALLSPNFQAAVINSNVSPVTWISRPRI